MGPIFTEQFEYEFIPAQRPSPGPKKLMIVLHGRGDSLRPFRSIGDELGLPEMNFLLLNAPRKYAGGYTWYGFPPRQARGVLEARSRLRILMEELADQGFDSQQVYLFGFSQGALVSCDFGLNYDRPLGGIIAVSGYLYLFSGWRRNVPAAAYQTPWLLTHGFRDDALDIDFTRAQVRELLDVGLPIKWLEFDKGHEIDEEREAPLIRRFVRSATVTPQVQRPSHQHRPVSLSF